ncbi:hypothetical protein BLNAU_6953 [Blattamonas nauphoetae]|uniref:Sugar phosphate transporter domain-containing protein n=1 Tax=Blattamonas nauphoetae TaxID=2049346 RepID=A0ABQ9Y2Q4_9EUKA|nr:hypothetical protein BLNAU_6953 [Blattamonas nauphoetae]
MSKPSTFVFVGHAVLTLVISVASSMLSEKIFKDLKQYKGWALVLLFPFLDSLVSFLFHAANNILSKNKTDKPFTRNEHLLSFFCGFLYSISIFLASYAKRFITSPISTTLSSSRVLLAMPMSILTKGRKKNQPGTFFGYSPAELGVSLLLFVGLLALLLPSNKSTQPSEPINWFGVLLMFLSVNISCLFDELQSLLLKSGLSSSLVLRNNMMSSTFFIFLFMLILGTLPDTVKMIKENPQTFSLWGVMLIVNVLSQVLVVELKVRFGIWWKNIVTSLRKCISVLMSIIVFKHPVSMQQGVGLFIVFSSTFWGGHVEMNRGKPKQVKPEKGTNMKKTK